MTGRESPRTLAAIFRFWVPLAATWLMMAVEGPFLAAVIARLADPKFNLAAYGIAFAFAVLVEAPVIMLMSASTALAKDDASFRRLRNFTYALNGIVTATMVVLLLPPVFDLVMLDVLGLPPEVARLTEGALWILLPWPGAIGYRRFYQGILIREGATRRVAYGTVLRLVTMSVTALVLYVFVAPPGVYVGAAALSLGVSVEAIASRWMARRAVNAVRGREPERQLLSYRRIVNFYYPLALTSVIGLAVQPMLTFFMGRAPSPIESLAVYPVVHALSFIFRAMGLSYQEVAIALMGDRFEHVRPLSTFAVILGLSSSAGLAFVGLTPFAHVWFETVSGLTTELARFAIPATVILIPLPALSVLMSLQRAILVVGRHTRPIVGATFFEVGGVAVLFIILINATTIPGVTAAVTAFLGGRIAGMSYLMPPCWRVVRAVR
ncbi:MAG: hypothetical protein V3T56_08545 [Gemmatimonadales bacterium]